VNIALSGVCAAGLGNGCWKRERDETRNYHRCCAGVAGRWVAATWFLVLKEDTTEVKPPEPEPITATFLELDALNVPVIQDGKIQRYILLRVTLDMRDDEVRTSALSYMPKLRDKLFNDLYGYFENLPANAQGVNIKAIKRRMLRTSNEVLGDGAVQKILVQGVFERPWKGSR
jgi:flagellar basal body-associated protein FliL